LNKSFLLQLAKLWVQYTVSGRPAPWHKGQNFIPAPSVRPTMGLLHHLWQTSSSWPSPLGGLSVPSSQWTQVHHASQNR
jgi:hypothetical protein